MGRPALLSIDQPPVDTQATVNSVRIGEHPEKIRITLDLSAPTSYRVLEQNDQARILVELPAATWVATRTWQAAQLNIVSGFTVEEMKEGGTRLIINAVKGITVREEALLEPNGSKGHRLYIDISQ